jgi:acetoacetate decarboxylase
MKDGVGNYTNQYDWRWTHLKKCMGAMGYLARGSEREQDRQDKKGSEMLVRIWPALDDTARVVLILYRTR